MTKLSKISAFILTAALVLSLCSGLLVFSAKTYVSSKTEADAQVSLTNLPDTVITGGYSVEYTIDIKRIASWDPNGIKTLKVTFDNVNGDSESYTIAAAYGKINYSDKITVKGNGKLVFNVETMSGNKNKLTFDITFYTTAAASDKTAPVITVFSTPDFGTNYIVITVNDPDGIKTFTVDGIDNLGASKYATDKSIPYDLTNKIITVKTTDIYDNVSQGLIGFSNNGQLVVTGDIKINSTTTGTPSTGTGMGRFIKYSKELETVELTSDKAVFKAPSAVSYHPYASFYLAYQWQVRVGAYYVNIPGERGDTLTVKNPEKGVSYRVAVSDIVNDFFYYSTAVYLDSIPDPVPEPEPDPVPEPEPEPEPEVTFTADDIKVAGVPTEAITVGDIIILLPEPLDGSWTFDSRYLSGLNEGIVVLKAEEAGTTVIKYRVLRDGEIYEKNFVITIKPDETPVKVPEVPTCDD